MIIKLTDILSGKDDIESISDYLMHGGIMVYPTDTVYGIGCNAFDTSAVEMIVSVKQREQKKPLIILVRDKEMLQQMVRDIGTDTDDLINRFWPGPLTIVFKARSSINKLLTVNTGTIAVRQSSHPFIEYLFKTFEYPLVSTSANISNETPASSIDELNPAIVNKVDLIIDGGRINKTPSTVVDATSRKIKYIREGKIKKNTIERFLHDRDKSI